MGNAYSLRHNSALNSKHSSVLRARRATVSKSNKRLCLQWLHARSTIIMALNSYFCFAKKRPVPCPDHRVINCIITVSFGAIPKILILSIGTKPRKLGFVLTASG